MSADLAQVAAAVRKGCRNRDHRDLLLAALQDPAVTRARLTTNGVMIFTTQGMVAAHFTPGGGRGERNLKASLRRIGIHL